MSSWRRFGLCAALAFSAPITPSYADNANPLPDTAVDWSGVYVGVQGGGAIANAGWTFPLRSFFTVADGSQSFDAHPSGGFGGGHVIWNRQDGPYVFGAELAFNSLAVNETRYGPFTPLYPDDKFDTSIDRYGTLTARFGYARDDALLYATGGYARGKAKFRAISGEPVAGVIGEIEDDLNGWTVGAGIAYQLRDNILLSAQYDFIRFNGDTSATATTGTPDDTPFVLRTEDISMHAISLRLSVRLDPISAEPQALK
jgi:outer membrane immunogenic protein